MGLKNSATCTLNFGDDGKCVGTLLGEEKQGIQIMFHLMNEARIATGVQAQGQSSAAYMHAVTYARNRIQGSHITQSLNPDAPKIPIINHPDVQRMLIWMKGYVEGMRMLTCFLSYCIDVSDIEEMGQSAYGLTSADFNDDGLLDFAASWATSPWTQSTISIFYNDFLYFLRGPSSFLFYTIFQKKSSSVT